MTDLASPLMVWGLSLATLAYGGLSIYLSTLGYLRPPVNRTGLAVLVASALTCLWAALGLASIGARSGWFWPMAVDVCRYAAWFAFVIFLFRSGQGRETVVSTARWMAPMSIALPVLGLLTLIFPALWGRPLQGGLSAIFLVMMLLAVFGLVLVEQLLRNLPEDALWSAKPIGLGMAGTFVFDLYLFSQAALFQGIDRDALDIRALVHAALMPLILVSTTRHRNWIAKIQISRQVVFHSASLLLVGGYLLFIAGVGYYVRFFGSDWGRALQLALFFLGTILLIALALSRSFRARVRVLLGKHFFRYRYDYREEWLKFTQTLSSQSAPEDMGLHVIRGLADMVESPAGMLWMHRQDEALFRDVARWNIQQVQQSEPAGSALMSFMTRTGWVINLEEYRSHPERYEHLTLPDWLANEPQAWLLVPLWLGTDLLGFVVLGSPRTRISVNWEVNDLLKTAGRQAASFLAQIQATEALLEARKFESFSRMSAFVVHDLKNIVTQLSLMMKNAKRLGHNPEFQADMLMTVENSLERMRQLMLQLREGAAPGGGRQVGVDLGRLAQELATAAARRGRTVELSLQPRVSTRGHEDRLERVMGHLVNNALDATGQNQRVWLKVDRYGSHARVEVGDNGSGMAADFVKERLFKPFQTTKASGMGIGAYESFQYVQELGGKITVDSEEGSGTVVTLLLPLLDTFQPSELQQQGEA